jgi:hypothetical protein
MTRIVVASYQHSFGKTARDREFELTHPDVSLFREMQQASSGGWRLDRNQELKLPFDSVLLDKYRWPQWDQLPNLSFTDAAMLRAQELINKGQPIYLLWSGGIDSTTVLAAFFRLGQSLDRITVVCNNDAIRENPNFYFDHIRGRVTTVATELFMQQFRNGQITAIVVNGEHGDLCAGYEFQYDMVGMFGPDFMYKPTTRENIAGYFRACGMSDQASNCWYDLIMTSAKTSPRPIDTAFDFGWWASFNWRWQWGAEKFRIRFPKCDNYEPFFSSDAIQKWSVNQTQPDLRKMSDLKPEFKQFIFDYTGDQDYLDHKIKHNSISLYFAADAYAAVMSDDSRPLSKDFSILDHYQEDNFMKQWLSV